MVLLSEETYQHCGVEALRQAGTLVAHMGEHLLKGVNHGAAKGRDDNDTGSLHLYTAVTRTQLLHRFAMLGPVRSVRPVSPTFLEAPYGAATVCFMYATGVTSLRAWSSHITSQALDLYLSIAQVSFGCPLCIQLTVTCWLISAACVLL
jgi:hypothetical protein